MSRVIVHARAILERLLSVYSTTVQKLSSRKLLAKLWITAGSYSEFHVVIGPMRRFITFPTPAPPFSGCTMYCLLMSVCDIYMCIPGLCLGRGGVLG